MSAVSRIRKACVEVLLWLAALAGLTAIVLVICAHLFGISLILFRTGSMEPTIPQGSAAVVREVPAAAVEVGDVVTVDRPGQMPVTHRVTSVSAGQALEERVLTMQGDSNDSEDPYPYTVTEVREVLWSVPGLAQPIHRMGDPWLMGTITMAAALLVGWAFWPRDDGSTPSRRHRPRHASAPSARALAVMVGGCAALTAGGLLMADAPAAHAVALDDEPQVEVIAGQHLQLTSSYLPQASRTLAPGEVVPWEVAVETDAPGPGELRLGLSSTGDVPLRVRVESCGVPWADPGLTAEAVCPDGAVVLREAEDVPRDGSVESLGAVDATDPQWLRVLVALSDGASSEPSSGLTSLRVHAEAFGDDLTVTPPSTEGPPSPDDVPGQGAEDHVPGADDPTAREPEDLASTGAALLLLLLAAVGSLVVGHLLRRRRRAPARSADAADPAGTGDGEVR